MNDPVVNKFYGRSVLLTHAMIWLAVLHPGEEKYPSNFTVAGVSDSQHETLINEKYAILSDFKSNLKRFPILSQRDINLYSCSNNRIKYIPMF